MSKAPPLAKPKGASVFVLRKRIFFGVPSFPFLLPLLQQIRKHAIMKNNLKDNRGGSYL